MTGTWNLQMPLELAYRRSVLFALELLDAVTLERVSRGIRVEAEGLRGKPVLNTGGFFVWLDEDFDQLQRITIQPGLRPYEPRELTAAEVTRPLTKVELAPRPSYPFPAGVTGLRGTLVESQAPPPDHPEPVTDAKLRLQWRDEDDHWHDAPGITSTDIRSGDFVSTLRPAPNEQPGIDAGGFITVRLQVSREGFNDRRSDDLKLLPGRIKGPPNSESLIFAWDDLLP